MRAVISQMPKHWVEERKKSEASQWDEMWNGVLHIPIMPNRLQQNIAKELMIYLDCHWEKPGRGRVNQEVNLTTPEDEAAWTLNYRIPDLVLLDPPRFGIDKIEYMVGAHPRRRRDRQSGGRDLRQVSLLCVPRCAGGVGRPSRFANPRDSHPLPGADLSPHNSGRWGLAQEPRNGSGVPSDAAGKTLHSHRRR